MTSLDWFFALVVVLGLSGLAGEAYDAWRRRDGRDG